VADAVAIAAAEAAGLEADVERQIIDLADYGGELFDWSSSRVREVVAGLAGASLAVVASPTYKATYTGLLKAYLDWFGQTDLNGVTVIPVMVGAAAHHALAVEVHLRPVLVEIGASLPTRGLYLTEDVLDEMGAVVDGWLVEAGPLLARAVRHPR